MQNDKNIKSLTNQQEEDKSHTNDNANQNGFFSLSKEVKICVITIVASQIFMAYLRVYMHQSLDVVIINKSFMYTYTSIAESLSSFTKLLIASLIGYYGIKKASNLYRLILFVNLLGTLMYIINMTFRIDFITYMGWTLNCIFCGGLNAIRDSMLYQLSFLNINVTGIKIIKYYGLLLASLHLKTFSYRIGLIVLSAAALINYLLGMVTANTISESKQFSAKFKDHKGNYVDNAFEWRSLIFIGAIAILCNSFIISDQIVYKSKIIPRSTILLYKFIGQSFVGTAFTIFFRKSIQLALCLPIFTMLAYTFLLMNTKFYPFMVISYSLIIVLQNALAIILPGIFGKFNIRYQIVVYLAEMFTHVTFNYIYDWLYPLVGFRYILKVYIVGSFVSMIASWTLYNIYNYYTKKDVSNK